MQVHIVGEVESVREHIVKVAAKHMDDLRRWLERPNGSFTVDRATLEAVEGGGILVRTRPFGHGHEDARQAALLVLDALPGWRGHIHRASTEAHLHCVVGAPGDRGFTVEDQQWWIFTDGGWKKA